MTPSHRVVPFVKANACGNDFLIIDGMYVPPDVAEFSKRICDRYRGVGADGVEWLFPDPDVDVRANCSTPMARKQRFPATVPAVWQLTSARNGLEKTSRSGLAPGSRAANLSAA
jgi:hypothetical protein